MKRYGKLDGDAPNVQLKHDVFRIKLMSALVMAALAATSGVGHAENCADVGLVLAIDRSGSVNAAIENGFPGAFVMRVAGFERLADAMAEKLCEAASPDVAVTQIGPFAGMT